MAMPPPPPKTPARPGNSQQVARAVHHDAVQSSQRPREIHPAVTEFQNNYARVWEDNDRLREENSRLIHDNEVLRQVDKEKSALIETLRASIVEAQKVADQRLATQEEHYRGRLTEAERHRERYMRYAVSMSTDLKSAISNLEAADATAMEMAHSPGEKALTDVERAIAEATHAVEQRPATVDELQVPKSPTPGRPF
jgi:hypothetical protein